MKRTILARRSIATLVVLASAMVTTVLFQNCGKAGFDSTDASSTAGLLGKTGVSSNSTIANAPFPFDASVNSISYMSCPRAGDLGVTRDPFELGNPFYNIRVGAYDNTAYASAFNVAGLTDVEKDRRLRAGIGLNQDFLNYVSTKMKTSDASMVSSVLQGQSLTQDMNLTLALVNSERSHAQGGFGFSIELYKRLLSPLSSSTMATLVSKGERNSNMGTKKVGDFPSLDASQRSIVGSLSWGKAEVDRKRFLSSLKSDSILALGYMPSSGTNIGALASPTSDPYTTLRGTGYRMSFSTSSPQGFVSSESSFLRNIEEMNMEVKPLTSLTAAEGRTWDCFSLAIVRHIDRLDSVAPFKPMTQCRNPSTGALTGQTTGICDGKTASGTLLYGVKRICPVQIIASLETRNGPNSTKLNAVRLAMARRMLPAELWELNTDPNYMCAVPTDLGMTKGKCYASGDDTPNTYIQYDLTAGGTSNCGASPANECPAFVSICYRTN